MRNTGRKVAALLVVFALLVVGSPSAIRAQSPGSKVATPFDGTPATGVATSGSGIITLSHPPDKFLAEVLWDGADNLVSEQNPDGRWSWPNKATGSPASNIGGPTGEGLLGAYRLTQEQAHLDSAILAGDFMKAQTVLSTHDPLFLINLSVTTGDSSYQQAAVDIYFTPLENGTYVRKGVTYSTTTYIDLVRSVRAAYPQYLAWDFSATCIAATQLGTADAALFCDAVREGLNALDPGDSYHTIAVAGGVWALAEIGDTTFTTTAGAYPGSTLSDLADLLVSWQTSQGYFPYDPLSPTEDVQETAYSVLGLDTMSGYGNEVLAAVLWLMGQQGVDGKWEACTGCGNYTEVDGETTWACSLLAPSEVVVDDDWISTAIGDSVGDGTFGINRLPTVQDGVNGVTGSVVNVSPGTYVQQVVITNDDLHLLGAGAGTTTIQAPSLLVGDASGSKNLLTISGASNTEVAGFTLSAAGVSGLNIGVYVRDGATDANIHDNVLQDLGTGSSNVGILVGRAYHAVTATATITNNVVNGYGKGGIVVDNLGSSANVVGNTISGMGPTPSIAQNGIQVSRGATATVVNNTVSAHVWTGSYGGSNDPVSDPDADGSTGVLLYHSGAVTVTNNVIAENQFGLWSVGAPSVQIANNTITGTMAGGYVFPVGIAVSDADQWTEALGFSEAQTIGSITNNTIVSQTYALFIQDYTPGGAVPGVHVGGSTCGQANHFSGSYAVWYAVGSGHNLDARFNDWGVYSTADIENLIWHESDDPALGRVFFEPFCGQMSGSVRITSPISGTELCFKDVYSVTVQVENDLGQALPDAVVSLFASSGQLTALSTPVLITCTTDALGECSFNWVPESIGTQYLMASTGQTVSDSVPVSVKLCGSGVVTTLYLPLVIR